MQAQVHWMDTVIAMSNNDIGRAKAAMRGQINRTILRKPPIQPQIIDMIAAPEQYPVDARARLAKMMQDRYGEQARNVLPYLGINPEETS